MTRGTVAIAVAALMLGALLGFTSGAVVFGRGAELVEIPQQTPTPTPSPTPRPLTPEELEECPPPDDLEDGESWICFRIGDGTWTSGD